MTPPSFDYVIVLSSSWPPNRRPEPPLSPSSIEVIRSCPLRGCFEASPGYERRLGFAARVGTAFHRVLQSLSEHPLPFGSLDLIANEVQQRFQRELAAQEAAAADRPRERGLPRDQNRVQRSLEAAVAEGFRVAGGETTSQNSSRAHGRFASVTSSATAPGGHHPPIEVEVPVQSRDGLFHGRVDRAEHRDDGTWLFDYKSALRDDLPDRYQRQLQLYALMWYDTRATWPVEARVVYPLAGITYDVNVQPELCRQVASEATDMLARLKNEPMTRRLALPGDTCKVCDFRPWCQPFWQWQANEAMNTVALDRASLGFEGRILDIDWNEQYWRLRIAWRNAEISLSAPQERFSQLTHVVPGMQVRVLDTSLRGQRHQPQAIVTPLSELFLVS